MNQPGNKCESKEQAADNLQEAGKGANYGNVRYFNHVTHGK